jgi:hypothetical protein
MRRSSKRSKRSGKQGGSNYAVGYKRPPVATRFRRGSVGNPRGRPKKQKTVGQIIEEGLTTKIRVEKDGQSKTMTALEHIIAKLIEEAAGGDMRAISTVFALEHRYKHSPETTLNMKELDEQDRELVARYAPMLGTAVVSGPSSSGGSQEGDENKATDSETNAKASSTSNRSDGDES